MSSPPRKICGLPRAWPSNTPSARHDLLVCRGYQRMSDLQLIFTLLAIGLHVWFWADSQRAREHALQGCRWACAKIDAQLLDETVALRRLSIARNHHGHTVWRRTYNFEYSLAGAQRLRGSVVLRGRAVETVAIQSPEGGTQFEHE